MLVEYDHKVPIQTCGGEYRILRASVRACVRCHTTKNADPCGKSPPTYAIYLEALLFIYIFDFGKIIFVAKY
uniref:Uncharacterized protein n=1 Tax=Romanomermis culicivorax TaxID=13658 RepID=A0A915HM57_ROMCU